MANLPALAASCADLEPTPLPSAGVTRPPRYYGRLRHPAAARPVPRGRPVGISRLPATEGFRVASEPLHACMPSPIPRRNRRPALLTKPNGGGLHRYSAAGLPRYPFRGLLGVHSGYGLHARQAAHGDPSTGGFDCFVSSTAAPIATGWSDSCRACIPPAEVLRLSTAHE